MNWLAHVFLSEPDTEFRLGNLLADCLKRHDCAGMPENFRRGMRQHQRIDAFTDTHPVVHRSRSRLKGDYRHARGILIDVFYDHLLAVNWERFCPQRLEAFNSDFYAAVRAYPIALPAEARSAIDYILDDDRLTSYRSMDGIGLALGRLSKHLSARLNKPIALDRGISDLQASFGDLQSDFLEFFPLLQNHVGGNSGDALKLAQFKEHEDFDLRSNTAEGGCATRGIAAESLDRTPSLRPPPEYRGRERL